MGSRFLLLWGVLVLAGCSSASASGYAAADYPEEATSPSPTGPGAAQGYGYSFEAEPEHARTDSDLVMTQMSSRDSSSRAKSRAGGMPAPPRVPAPATDPLPPQTEVEEPAPVHDLATDQSRKPMLVYKARLGLAVFKVQEQLDTIEKMTKDQGGYLVARTQNEIRVRVPAQHFQVSIDAILKLGDVNFRQITTDDVTAEFTDLEIRLKNALSVRDRLQLLLEKAQKVEEAIEVERELQRLTDEIETMKGRLKLLNELAAYSTIDVSFSERSSQLKSRVELPFPWLESLGLEHLLSL